MNFYVNNTDKITNFPESGIIVLPFYSEDGKTATSVSSKISVDENYVYYCSALASFRTKNINNLVALDTNGNITNQTKPRIATALPSTVAGNFNDNFKIIYSDENHLYILTTNLFLSKRSLTYSYQIYRINKSNNTIDPDFCLVLPYVGSIASASSSTIPTNVKMFKYNNKYYILCSLAGAVTFPKIPYFIKDQNLSSGLSIIKDKKLISNFKFSSVNSIFYAIKTKDNYTYICHRANSEANKIQYPKLFRLNDKNILDKSFFPYIEKYNSTSAAAAGSTHSEVTDFDFANDGIFFGGNFLTVNGDTCTGLAKIDYSGNRITGFNPSLGPVNTTTFVNGVASSGSGVFICGNMNYNGDATKSRLLKLHDDGTLNTQFTGGGITSAPNKLLLSGNSLYIINGNSLSGSTSQGYGRGIFKVNADSGSFDPNFNINLGLATVFSAIKSGNSLYICTNAEATYINNITLTQENYTGILKVNATNGEIDTNFKVKFNENSNTYGVIGMAVKNNELHIVGQFSGIEGKIRNSYAVVNPTNGNLIDSDNVFLNMSNTNSAGILRSINYDKDLIIGHQQSTSNAQIFYITGLNYQYNSNIQIYDQNFNIETGINSQFAATYYPYGIDFQTGIQFLAPNTGLIVTGSGLNTAIVTAINLDNLIVDNKSFYLSTADASFASIYGIQKYNNNFFFGGGFRSQASNEGRSQIRFLIKTNSSGIVDQTFNLSLDGSDIKGIKIIGDSLFGWGKFTGISGTKDFFKFNLTSGYLETGFNYLTNQYNLQPVNVVNDTKNNIYVLTYFQQNAYNYMFTGYNGYNQTSGNILKFNSGSYAVEPNFTSKHFNIYSNQCFTEGDKIYTNLKSIGRADSSNVYKINRKSREIEKFNVKSSGNFFQDVYNEGDHLYLAGNFSGFDGYGVTGLCRLYKTGLNVDTGFNYNFINASNQPTYPSVLLKKDNYLYCLGSSWVKINNTSISGLARIDLTTNTLDTSFSSINHSGFSLSTVSAVFSGNNLYVVGFDGVPLRIYNVQDKLLKFASTSTEAQGSLFSCFAIENVDNFLVAGMAHPTTTVVSNPKSINGRTRGLVTMGFNTGEIANPYGGFLASNTLPSVLKYHSFSNNIFMGTNTVGSNINNSHGNQGGAWTHITLFDKDKMFVKNKFNFFSLSTLPTYDTQNIPRIYNNELYYGYGASLLSNLNNPYEYAISNVGHYGVIKFNSRLDDYEIIL